MSKTFEQSIDKLSEISGYSWDFLVDRYNDMVEDGDFDWEYFVGVSAERDWTILSPLDLRSEERDIYEYIGERAWINLAKPALAHMLC